MKGVQLSPADEDLSERDEHIPGCWEQDSQQTATTHVNGAATFCLCFEQWRASQTLKLLILGVPRDTSMLTKIIPVLFGV